MLTCIGAGGGRSSQDITGSPGSRFLRRRLTHMTSTHMTSTLPLPSVRHRRRRWPWFVLGILVLGLVGAGVYSYSNGNQARRASAISVDDLDLRVGKAEVSDIQVTVNEVGTVEPVVKVDVKSTLSGKVTDLLVREGDKVSAGQVLARVEPDVNQAQTLSSVSSGMKMAEIRANDAKKDLETNERLHQEGYLSDQELKSFRLKFDETMESLQAAKTNMRIVEESGIPLQG